MTDSKLKFIMLIGPPGSGKGTQGTLLSERLGACLFETSRILEEYFAKAKDDDFLEINGNKYFAKEEAKKRAEGKLCSIPFVFELIKNKIIELAKDRRSVITAGSPRSIEEGQMLLPILQDLYGQENITAVEIDIPVEDSVFRNSRRRICELMRHSILYSQANEKLEFCPIDGSKLVKRQGVGDDARIIKTRYQEYLGHTAPLMDFFKKNGIRTIKVNGSTTPADLFKMILEKLGYDNH